MKDYLRICFMGTPEFAVESLIAINNSNHKIVGVVTAVDKPAGRGRKLNESDVKKFAVKNNLPLYQPTNLKSEKFYQELKLMNPDVIIVVAFRMLPKQVWSFPKFGTFNLHASILPNYRGAAPIHWAVINGELETGVTTFFIDEKIDTGNIILTKKCAIQKNDNVGKVYNKLMKIGAELIIDTLQLILEKGENVETKIQNTQLVSTLKVAPKLTKVNTRINWNTKGEDILNLIRGLNPFPVAWTVLHQNQETSTIKIYNAKHENFDHNKVTGKIKIEKQKLGIYTANGILYVEELKAEGKRMMDIKDFLNGYTIDENARFY